MYLMIAYIYVIVFLGMCGMLFTESNVDAGKLAFGFDSPGANNAVAKAQVWSFYLSIMFLFI